MAATRSRRRAALTCEKCRTAVRKATRGGDGTAIVIEAVGEDMMVGFDPIQPFRNMQLVRAYVLHDNARCSFVKDSK